MTTLEIKNRIDNLWKKVDDAANEGDFQYAFECTVKAEHLEKLLQGGQNVSLNAA